MRIILKVQQHLAAFYRASDDGTWFAVVCRRGAEEAMGRRLKPNEIVEIELTVTELPPSRIKGQCPECNGRGVRDINIGPFDHKTQPCPVCGGTGLEATPNQGTSPWEHTR
jgi:hypothetical protein